MRFVGWHSYFWWAARISRTSLIFSIHTYAGEYIVRCDNTVEKPYWYNHLASEVRDALTQIHGITMSMMLVLHGFPEKLVWHVLDMLDIDLTITIHDVPVEPKIDVARAIAESGYFDDNGNLLT